MLDRQAQIALMGIASCVESKNTDGSGERFVKKFKKFIQGYAKQRVQYGLCKNEVLASFRYSCILFNKWVVVFSIEKDVFKVHKIIHGSILA